MQESSLPTIHCLSKKPCIPSHACLPACHPSPRPPPPIPSLPADYICTVPFVSFQSALAHVLPSLPPRHNLPKQDILHTMYPSAENKPPARHIFLPPPRLELPVDPVSPAHRPYHSVSQTPPPSSQRRGRQDLRASSLPIPPPLSFPTRFAPSSSHNMMRLRNVKERVRRKQKRNHQFHPSIHPSHPVMLVRASEQKVTPQSPRPAPSRVSLPHPFPGLQTSSQSNPSPCKEPIRGHNRDKKTLSFLALAEK